MSTRLGYKQTEIGEIPGDWKLETLDKICEKPQYGYTQSATEKPIGPRFLRITDIQDGGVNWQLVPFCECPDGIVHNFLLQPNDILFARTGATTGRRIPASHQRCRNRRCPGLGGLRDVGACGECVSHAEARSGVASGVPSPGGARRSPCLVLLDRLRAVLDAGADASATRRIAEWPPRTGGVAWHSNGNDLFAKSGWDEVGTGKSQYSPIRRSDGPALAERCSAATARSFGPSGPDASRGDPIRAG